MEENKPNRALFDSLSARVSSSDFRFLHVSADKNMFISEQSPSQPNKADVKFNLESRCVKRKDLLETMEREVPLGTIRYSSKVVSIEEVGKLKLVHLEDGSVVKTKKWYKYLDCHKTHMLTKPAAGYSDL